MMNKWISGISGLAIAVVPFVALSETMLTWILVIFGLAITISSISGMIAEPGNSRRTHGIGSHI